jgi:hypothetical protein
MDALDGNAIAGLLFETFGLEMTSSEGTCGTCGATARVAELSVYVRAPGTVVRCPACDAVLMVIVDVRGTMCVDLRGLRSLEIPTYRPVREDDGGDRRI